MKRILASLFLLAAVLAHAQSPEAPAQNQSPLVNEMRVFIVTQGEDGKEVLTPTESISPGDVAEYQLIYRNQSAGTLSRILAVGPIPSSTDYVDGSATAPDGVLIEFSADGGATYSVPPVYYTRVNEDGTQEKAVATPDMYARVRWTIPSLAAGEEKLLTYRVVIE